MIRFRDSDGKEKLGWITGDLDDKGRIEYYVAGEQRLRYSTKDELDGIVTSYEPDEHAPATAQLSFALNDEFTIKGWNGEMIQATITKEVNEDGLVEVYTEQPINGSVVNQFTPEELTGMVAMYNGEAIAHPEETRKETAVLNQPVSIPIDNIQETTEKIIKPIILPGKSYHHQADTEGRNVCKVKVMDESLKNEDKTKNRFLVGIKSGIGLIYTTLLTAAFYFGMVWLTQYVIKLTWFGAFLYWIIGIPIIIGIYQFIATLAAIPTAYLLKGARWMCWLLLLPTLYFFLNFGYFLWKIASGIGGVLIWLLMISWFFENAWLFFAYFNTAIGSAYDTRKPTATK